MLSNAARRIPQWDAGAVEVNPNLLLFRQSAACELIGFMGSYLPESSVAHSFILYLHLLYVEPSSEARIRSCLCP